MSNINRRDFIKAIAAASSASVLAVPRTAFAKSKATVVVVGGGFGGAAAAKYIKMMDPGIDVTLIEKEATYVSCPSSNEVISGHRDIKTLQIGYDGLKKRGVNVIQDQADAIDAAKKTVKLKSGKTLNYDALVLSPGIDFNYAGIQGYSQEIAETIPHAYKAGAQTLALKNQLEAMPDGGKFVITVPPKPFRCPPGPYERAAQVAMYLKHHGKKKSKVIILDANDSFSKKALFEQAWSELYGYGKDGMIEWVAGAAGGKVTKIDPKTKTAYTDFHEMKADVLNVIPPHQAGKIAVDAGLANAQGWCEVVPMTMASVKDENIYTIGDACIAGELPVYDMPKSAHMAITQAKVAAGAIVAKVNGAPPPVPYYVNTCYSVVAEDWGFSVVHIFKVDDGKFVYVKEAGGVSPVTFGTKEAPQPVPRIYRKLEAEYAVGWLNNVMADAFS